MIPQDVLKILCCPETKVPLQLAPPALLQELNGKIATQTLQTKGGETLKTKLSAGLVTTDGATFYRIEDEIPILLIEEGIVIS